MDVLIHFYESLPKWLQFIINFFFVGIILKRYVADKIMSFIIQRGWLPENIIGSIMKHIKAIPSVTRKIVITQHYRQGHQHDDVVGCHEGNCNLITDTFVRDQVTA